MGVSVFVRNSLLLILFSVSRHFVYMKYSTSVCAANLMTLKLYLDHFIHGGDVKALTCSTWCSYPPQILTW